MKRIIYILLVVFALSILLGGITVFADNSAVNLTRGTCFDANEVVNFPAPESVYGESESKEANSENITDSVTEAQENYATDGADDKSQSKADNNANPNDGGNKNANPDDDGSKNTNPFELIFNTVKNYTTEILCALSFVGSLILAYAYKSGLLPIIKNGIGAIASTVSKIKDTTERGEEKTDGLSRELREKLSNTESALLKLNDSLCDMEKQLDNLSDEAGEREKLNLILSAQIDMLYGIFMTSSLPQYQKDEVGARIAEMREALIGYEKK